MFQILLFLSIIKKRTTRNNTRSFAAYNCYMRNLFNELVLVALDKRKGLSHIPTKDEWQYLYVESVRQAICGVLLSGGEKLPKEQRPSSKLLYEWIGNAFLIESRNTVLNQRCVELQNFFAQGGFTSCILKGQGNALMYPVPLRRQSGDIDIWVNGDVKDISHFLSSKCNMKAQVVGYHHIEFPLWNDVEVEVHWRPSWKSSPLHNRRMQRWFREMSDRQFASVDVQSGLHVPTWDFNVVYLLQHMYLHIFQEGLGLRQVVDYYYLLKSDKRMEVQDLEKTLRRLDLYHFAGAVMYVLREALGMEEKFFIVPVDERRGAFLLEEIMQSGNFGRYDERNRELAQKTGISRSLARLKRQYRFLRDYPIEVLCAPFQVYHVIWRKLKLWRWE